MTRTDSPARRPLMPHGKAARSPPPPGLPRGKPPPESDTDPSLASPAPAMGLAYLISALLLWRLPAAASPPALGSTSPLRSPSPPCPRPTCTPSGRGMSPLTEHAASPSPQLPSAVQGSSVNTADARLGVGRRAGGTLDLNSVSNLSERHRRAISRPQAGPSGAA